MTLCVTLFGLVFAVWWQHVKVEAFAPKTAAQETTDTAQETILQKQLDDLAALLEPIVTRVIQQKIRVVVDKDPKRTFTSPDISFDNTTQTMRITLPQGPEGPVGPPGRQGAPGPDAPQGPQGKQGPPG